MHGQLTAHQVLFCKAALQLVFTQSVLVTTLLLPLMNLLKFLLSLFLKTLEVPLNGSTTDQHISHSWQFHIVSKLAANALCPVTQVTNEEANLWGTTVVTGLQLGFVLLISTL